MKKEKIIKLFITLLTSIVIVFSILFYQNSIHENEFEKFSYKKYLHEFGFSKTENPTEEEIQNSDKYFKLLDKATYEKNKENYTEAENIYMEAVKYNILGYQEIGRMYLEEVENTGKAIEYFEKAYDKGDINAAFCLGKSYEKLNDENMKRKWYEKGALNGDTDSEIYFGRLLYLENKKDEAEKWFRKALINSKNAIAIYNLMMINYEKGNIKKVKKLQKQLHEKGVEEMDDDMLGKVKYMTGNKKQQHIFVYLNNADNFIEKKQYLEAEKEYIKAIKYDKKISVGVPRKWVCGIIPKEWNDEISEKSLTRTNTVLTVIDEECGNQIVEGKVERLKMYGKKLEEYFSKPRNFEEIDWYEFMKFNNIHPIITIYVGYFSKEKIEKIRDEIKPYYNQKDFTILFCYWVDNGNGYDEKYVW